MRWICLVVSFFLQVGHFCCVATALRMQSQQNTCPHVVLLIFSISPRHTVHFLAVSGVTFVFFLAPVPVRFKVAGSTISTALRGGGGGGRVRFRFCTTFRARSRSAHIPASVSSDLLSRFGLVRTRRFRAPTDFLSWASRVFPDPSLQGTVSFFRTSPIPSRSWFRSRTLISRTITHSSSVLFLRFGVCPATVRSTTPSEAPPASFLPSLCTSSTHTTLDLLVCAIACSFSSTGAPCDTPSDCAKTRKWRNGRREPTPTSSQGLAPDTQGSIETARLSRKGGLTTRWEGGDRGERMREKTRVRNHSWTSGR